MNKILRSSCYAVIALLSIAFTACTDEYEYDPAPVENDGAFILANGSTTIILGENDQQSLSFTVTRHDKTQAKTYKLYSSDENVPVPSEVSFAEGEEAKTLDISFNFPVGTIEKQVVIGVEEDTYIYGAHSQTYTISRCKALPEGSLLYSDLIGINWDIDIYEYGTTTDEETGVKTAKFVIKDPFYISPWVGLGNGNGYNFVFSLNSKGKAVAAQQSICEYEDGMDITAKGNGTYYPSYNMIQFLWSLDVPDLGGGFGSLIHEIYFPDDYDPIP